MSPSRRSTPRGRQTDDTAALVKAYDFVLAEMDKQVDPGRAGIAFVRAHPLPAPWHLPDQRHDYLFQPLAEL